MNTPKPINQVLLKISAAFQEEIITDSGIKFFIDPSYRKEHMVAVVAKVASLPIKYSKQEKLILDQLKVGDEVCMSYQVVADFEFQGDGERFMETTEDNPHTREYTNGKGEWVKCYALPKFTGISKIQWVGVYQDRQRKVISGVQGTESELERWMSQFQFGKTDIYSFNNFFEYKGQDYWKCSPNQIFAVKRKGHWVAINDRVICKPMDEEIPNNVLQLVRHNEDIKIRYQDRASVLTSNNKKIKKETVISFNPSVVEKYEVDGRQYYLVKNNLIQGKWN